MQRRRIAALSPLIALAAVSPLALVQSADAQPASTSTGVSAAGHAVPAAVLPGVSRTLYVTTAAGRVEVASRLAPGRYYVQLRTRDTKSSRLQVVKAQPGYTIAQYVADWARYEAKVAAADLAGAQAELDAITRKVTFYGGASVEPGGLGQFGTYFGAGTYWLYEDRNDGPTHANRIHTLVMTGGVASTRNYLPFVATSAYRGERLSLTASSLPRSGWVYTTNVAGNVRGQSFWRIPAGLSDAQVAACIGAPAIVAPTATPTVSTTASRMALAAVTPSATATTTLTAVATATTTITATPVVTVTPTATATPVVTVTPTVTASPTPKPTTTITPKPTVTATATPKPTVPCSPQLIQLTGRNSAGVGTPQYYSLLPGDYVVTDARPDRAGSSPVARGQWKRFTIAP